MKSLSMWTAALFCLAVGTQNLHAAPGECSANLPAGLIIRLLPDEKLIAGMSTGPTAFTVNADVRFFPNRPPLLARGSKVLATIAESKEAGHFYGKARIQLTLDSILTADFCEYPIDGKIIEVARNKVADNVIWGRGHARRDAIALLFPPTTVYQLVRLPSRGSKLVVDDETAISVKLMQSVSLSEERTMKLSGNRQPGVFRTEILSSPEQEATRVVAAACLPREARQPDLPIVQGTRVLRAVRNLTPYHVSLNIDNANTVIFPPCYGPSMISVPTTDLKLEASASLVTTTGQRQVRVKVVPNLRGDGWDILPDSLEPAATAAN
jgi:hypothetical protein